MSIRLLSRHLFTTTIVSLTNSKTHGFMHSWNTNYEQMIVCNTCCTKQYCTRNALLRVSKQHHMLRFVLFLPHFQEQLKHLNSVARSIAFNFAKSICAFIYLLSILKTILYAFARSIIRQRIYMFAGTGNGLLISIVRFEFLSADSVNTHIPTTFGHCNIIRAFVHTNLEIQ